ncbi:hypothetical protein VTI74DRAFT_9470 [Chaetomium olivicolor]
MPSQPLSLGHRRHCLRLSCLSPSVDEAPTPCQRRMCQVSYFPTIRALVLPPMSSALSLWSYFGLGCMSQQPQPAWEDWDLHSLPRTFIYFLVLIYTTTSGLV